MIGVFQWRAPGLSNSNGSPPAFLAAGIGLGVGVVVGALIAFWLLCVGYVYADAQRRTMPAVLWVLLVIFIPNLLGFLLYFALRRPLGLPCSNCGNLIAADQRFCPWCGSQRFATPPAPGGFPSTGSGARPAITI